MEHEDNCRAGTDNTRRGVSLEQCGGQEAPPGIGHSISPGMPCPETVLVARMNDGSYLLMAYPQREPSAFVVQDDAGPLRHVLADVFGNSKEAASGNGNGERTGAVVPGHEAPYGEQVQP